MAIQFKKARKYDARARVALMGPAGSGKSFTALRLGQLLAGQSGRIAALDTEHGSLSKYADQFDFDVLELDSYSPDNFQDALTAAEQGGYAVFLVDSLSHFWIGRDGALEFVDNARKRSSSRDDMSGWKEFRPHERAMVDRMIASPCHVIVTMRTKTAYEEQVNERTGKKQRVKIGLAPVQREGLEYEFDLVGAMNDDNELIVDKSRCSTLAGKVLSKPKPEDFEPFAAWLRGEARGEAQGAAPSAAGSAPPAAPAASKPLAPAPPPKAAPPPPAEVPPLVADMYKLMNAEKAAGFAKVFDGFLTTFQRLQGEQAGFETYHHLLGLHGVDSWQNFKSLQSARRCVLALYNKTLELTEVAQPAAAADSEAA